MSVFRNKCRSCPRTLDPTDLTVGLCPMCLLRRVEDFFKRFGPAFDKGIPPCFECGKSVRKTGGYMHWDGTANALALLCPGCSEKAIQTDEQYRGTEFAFAQKAQ